MLKSPKRNCYHRKAGIPLRFSAHQLKTFSVGLLAFLCLSCGGGSVGTGTGENLTTIEGRIITPEGLPLKGATVELSDIANTSTLSTAQTNELGQFVIAVPSAEVPETIQLDLTPATDTVDTTSAPIQNSEVVVQASSNSSDVLPTEVSSGIVVQVVVDENAPPVTIQNTSVTAQIVGDCHAFFENNRDITQIQDLPTPTTCSVRVEMQENGSPRLDARFQLEVRGCDDNSPWVPVLTGNTVSDGITAAGQLDFNYAPDIEHCVYRVVAPIDDPADQQTSFEIFSLVKQNFDLLSQPVSTPTPAGNGDEGSESPTGGNSQQLSETSTPTPTPTAASGSEVDQ